MEEARRSQYIELGLGHPWRASRGLVTTTVNLAVQICSQQLP
jgi:hypothetical protein